MPPPHFISKDRSHGGEVYPGTGNGLATVKRIAERLGIGSAEWGRRPSRAVVCGSNWSSVSSRQRPSSLHQAKNQSFHCYISQLASGMR